MPTLQELVKEAEQGNVRPVIEYLNESLKGSDEKKLGALSAQFEKILASQKEIKDTLQKIHDKPEKEYPEPKEFPAVQKVSGEVKISNPPDMEMMGKMCAELLAKEMKPMILQIVEAIQSEGEKTRQMMTEMDAEDEAEETPEGEAKTVNTGALRTRRTTQWKIATYPQVAGTVGLVSAGDGLTYYLPSACLPNSETVRLNGGLPLSHGIDYSISGNALVFVQDQSNSQIEVRYQVK